MSDSISENAVCCKGLAPVCPIPACDNRNQPSSSDKPRERLKQALHDMGTHSPGMLEVLGEHLSTAQAEEVLRLTMPVRVTNTRKPWQSEEEAQQPPAVQEAIRKVLEHFGELPDRNSPEDFPEGYVLTRGEIVDGILEVVGAFSATAQPTTPKWLVRAGGDHYETWVCRTREDVRQAFIVALYGDVQTAMEENTGDIAHYMEEFDKPRERGDYNERWNFEDGWLEVIWLADAFTTEPDRRVPE